MSTGCRVTSTAELAFALMLAVARKIPAAHGAAIRGHWARDVYRGRQLSGKTLGLRNGVSRNFRCESPLNKTNKETPPPARGYDSAGKLAGGPAPAFRRAAQNQFRMASRYWTGL
jgi:hypothetical protein